MTRAEAQRAAYELIANEIEALIDRHTIETWWSDDDWNAVLDELRRLHDKFQMKANPDRVIPAMRLDELEQLGGDPE